MQYLGSKNKIAKHLRPFILERLNPDQHYVEHYTSMAKNNKEQRAKSKG